MNFLEIVRVLVRNRFLIAFTAILLAGLVFWSTRNSKQEYATHTLLNTGVISGYNIESNKSSRIDYAFTNNEIENLINLATAYETQKELSARLMAHIMHQQAQGDLGLNADNYPDLQKSLANVPFEWSSQESEAHLFDKLIEHRDKDEFNTLYLLTNSEDPFFGTEQLENITVRREGKSDMIRIDYRSQDPFMCQLTLKFLIDIFIAKHKKIKEGQSNSVIEFFEEATQETSSKLKNAEDELLNFRVNNQIINYYEQTRFISGNKEELDKQYQEELKVLAGARSALARLDTEVEEQHLLPLLQSKVTQSRSEIARYATEISQIDLFADSTAKPNGRKAQLTIKVDSLKTAMTQAAEEIFRINQTPEGIETRDVLRQWLNHTITREESMAKLKVMQARKAEYEVIYDRFAPLGSTLKRLEREIDVAEREYLENLHSYNQALLHKYNMLMSSNLKVIDAPYYPTKPEKSKRMMLVVLAFMVGLILPSGVLIGMEFLDPSLKNAEKAREITGLKTVGALPVIPKNVAKSRVDFETLCKQATSRCLQELGAKTRKVKTPAKVALLSTQPGEGKSLLKVQLESLKPDFEFIEVDALLGEQPTASTFPEADVHVLVCQGRKQWNEADKRAVKVYQKLTGHKPLLFLNGVATHVMEEVVGEIPKRRSFIRKWVKRLVTGSWKKTSF